MFLIWFGCSLVVLGLSLFCGFGEWVGFVVVVWFALVSFWGLLFRLCVWLHWAGYCKFWLGTGCFCRVFGDWWLNLWWVDYLLDVGIVFTLCYCVVSMGIILGLGIVWCLILTLVWVFWIALLLN